MQIVCPNCSTSYRVEPSVLGAAGRSVRCARCQSVWFAEAPPPAVDLFPQDGTGSAAAFHDAGEPGQPDAFVAAHEAPPVTPDPGEPASPVGEPGIPPEPPFAADAPAVAGYLPDDVPLPPREPLAIDAAPAPVPMPHSDIAPSIGTIRGEDIETVAVRQAKRRRASERKPWPASLLPTALAALLVANVMLVVWRADVVKVLPQTASLYRAIGLPVNLRGLAFSNVTSTTETNDGVPVLVVEGTIESKTSRVVEVPRLRFSVRNPSGHEVYAWTALPGRSLLQPGETLAFRSRLASPPADGHDVIVRFFNRRDLVAGLQ